MWGVFRRGTYTGSGILIDQGGSNNGNKVNKKAEKQQGKKEKDTGIFRIAWGDHHTLCAGSLSLLAISCFGLLGRPVRFVSVIFGLFGWVGYVIRFDFCVVAF